MSTVLDMTRGRGANRTTFYRCGMVEEAKRDNKSLLVVKNGKVTTIPSSKTRMVHRPYLDDEYGQSHAMSGTGKYIAKDAMSTRDGRKLVTGAQHVNPFLLEEGSYRTIVECFHHLARGSIEQLTALLTRNRSNGQHLAWRGNTSQEGAVAVSEFISPDDLWDLGNKLNPDLKQVLRDQKAHLKKVKQHRDPKEKFLYNLDVLRRARFVLNVSTGETDMRGGETPYALPLEQCGFAIDYYFLTTGVDKQTGQEIGGYFYRMAYGRSTPWVLLYRDWRSMTASNREAFISEKVRKEVQKA